MKKSVELKQKRTALIEKQGELLKRLETDKRDAFTDSEDTEFRSLNTQIEDLKVEIESAEMREAAAERVAKNAKPEARGTSMKPEGSDEPEDGEAKEKRALSQRASVGKAIRSAMAGRELTGAEKEMNELAIEESRNAKLDIDENAKVNIPMSFLRAAAQTATEDAGEYGGALIQDHAPRVQMPFNATGVMDRLGATRLTGLIGKVPLPVMGDYEFQWLGETQTMTLQKSKIEGPVLEPHRLGAAVGISNLLLLQTSGAAETMIRRQLFNGYERAIDKAAINGSGAGNEPKGILNNTAVPTSTTVASAIPTKALAAELVSLVETANASELKLAFLSSPALKYLMETTLLDAGSGRFLMEKVGELIGYRYVTSTLVPVLATNFPLIFGDWSQMFIGEWGSVSILSDPYSGSLSNEVRLIVNAYADVEIAQPTAFAVNKFLNSEE